MATSDRPAKRAKLLSDAEDSSEDENEVSTAGFKVNEEYAARFEHNKKRQEKEQLEEKYGRSNGKRAREEDLSEDSEEDSSDDESEDDDAELATEGLDDEISATLQAIKSKDPRVYDKESKFYRDFEAEAGAENGDKKKEKPMYLQDYHRQNLLAGHNDAEQESEPAHMTYQDEQDAVQRAFVAGAHQPVDDDDEEDLFSTKSKPTHHSLPPPSRTTHITDADVAAADRDPENYLSNFMSSRAWLPNGSSRPTAMDSDDSEDEERADAFEEAYNMRFEDPKTANEKLLSFSRDVGKYGVRRDEKNSRKRARERERERKEAVKREREEEKARLRKLKIEEAEEKVARIKQAAGMKGKELDVEEWKGVIDGDFDDEKWEEEMRRRFGEDYYARDDDDEGEIDVDGEGPSKKKRKLSKPTWDDDIDIKDLVPEFQEEDAPVVLSDEDEEEQADAEPENADNIESETEHTHKKNKSKKDRTKAKAAAKRTARLERRAIEDIVDASLPFAESTPTTAAPAGFRYRATSPTSFGLTDRDVLFADDKDLNAFAGLKKLASFRDPEKKAKDRKRLSKKARLREWRKETFGRVDGPVVGGAEEEKDQAEGRDGERKKGKKRSRKAKKEKAKKEEIVA